MIQCHISLTGLRGNREIWQRLPPINSRIYWGSNNKGGLHDILFLLKSFDLDIRKRYPLGTVFSYGRQNEFQHYIYLLVAKETQSKIVEMVKDIQIGDVAYIVHKGLRTIGHTTSDIVDKALRYDTIRRHIRNMNRKQTKASQDSEVKQ